MKKAVFGLAAVLIFFGAGSAQGWFSLGKFTTLTPENGKVVIPLQGISDGDAHYFKVQSEKGGMVKFFVIKSDDGVVRAAVDACDVCYRSGKGYVREGNIMVCTNCGMRFATDQINEVRGGCNPAPLERQLVGENLVIAMDRINASAWLCEFKN